MKETDKVRALASRWQRSKERKCGRAVLRTRSEGPDDLALSANASDAGVPCKELLKAENRQKIIVSYLKILDYLRGPIRSDSELPFSKRLIQRAIIEELFDNPDSEMRSYLEVGFAEIESFIPVEEYEFLQKFKETFSQAEELAERGTPNDIMASCQLLERISGERAVTVLERISQAMRERFNAIQSIGMNPSMMLREGSCSSR
jgi:hypothetical protein